MVFLNQCHGPFNPPITVTLGGTLGSAISGLKLNLEISFLKQYCLQNCQSEREIPCEMANKYPVQLVSVTCYRPIAFKILNV